MLTLLRWSSSTPFRANASPNRLLAIQCCEKVPKPQRQLGARLKAAAAADEVSHPPF